MWCLTSKTADMISSTLLYSKGQKPSELTQGLFECRQERATHVTCRPIFTNIRWLGSQNNKRVKNGPELFFDLRLSAALL